MIAEARESIQQKKADADISLSSRESALGPYRESMHVIGEASAVANHIGFEL